MDALTVVGSILAGVVLLGAAVKSLPSVWAFTKATAKAPVILERMYAEFAPNGGGSLRDAIDRLTADLSGVLDWQSSHAEDDIRQLAELASHDVEMSEYLHKRMHELLNAMVPVVGWAPLHDKRLERIEKLLQISAEADEVVAADLAEAKATVQGVADDLAHEREGILHSPEAE